jgi:hypothetical protein
MGLFAEELGGLFSEVWMTLPKHPLAIGLHLISFIRIHLSHNKSTSKNRIEQLLRNSCAMEKLNHTSIVNSPQFPLRHLQPAAIAGFPSTRLISFHLETCP